MENEQKTMQDAEEKMLNLLNESNEAAVDIRMINNIMIQTIPYPMGFRTLMEGLETDLFVIPSFQRAYRWSEEQVEQLAISLVRGMPIPPIYGYRNKYSQIVILDGQQRLISLYLYYIGKCQKKRRNASINTCKLTDRKRQKNFRETLEDMGLKDKVYYMPYYNPELDEDGKLNISYQNFSNEARRVIDFTQLNIILINVDSARYKERILYKIFANLNKGGIPLSNQELRNGIYNCPFYDMLHRVNETNEKWRSIYGGGKEKDENKESKDVELLLKLCAFKKNVKLQNGKLKLMNYNGKISTLLDDFSEEVLEFRKQEIAEYENALISFFNCVDGIITTNKETLWPGLFVAAEQKEFDVTITKELCERIIKSDDYSKANKSGTSSKADIETRMRCVYEQL